MSVFTDLPEWNVPKQGSGVSIQCWSFSKVEDADIKLRTLLEEGYQAYRIAAALDDGKIWYRVRVGPLKSKKEAVRQVKDLKARYSLEKPFITEAP